ncbi:alpha-ketoacid dehydrogenase subunit alpha/beta [Thermonema rossianum]|uniref:alpha-ketoacid dehydrogenase subunit alpha/beta n=1 Tax=Thermonema rossianum TaxID=55505 RepID=UPI000A068CF9|nr:dehydrogenase E1 component subunit alpha/beta [Thermonema rossianum]
MAKANIQTPVLNYSKEGFDKPLLVELYKRLLKPRMIEEKMLLLLRQGKLSKWFSGIGQEAIAVGVASALHDDEFILPMHRNLGVFTTRQVPLQRLFEQFQGKAGGFTKGRDRSFHFGSIEHHIVGMISHLGPQLSVADGIALATKLSKEGKVTVAFTGEGATSEGEFHEALNVAAVWDLPVIFVIENNGYGLSTPVNEQYRCERLADRGIGYGMEAVQIEGNNILEVYRTIRHYAEEIRQNPRPVLIEAMTFRMRGHEEASGTKYVPKELMEAWAQRDPVLNYEAWLLEEKLITQEEVQAIRKAIKKEIDDAWKKADAAPYPEASVERELADVYAPFQQEVIKPRSEAKSRRRFVDAISDALRQSMERYPNLVLMGQDIAEYGGVFKITEGFVEQFGKERVRNTPLCESAIVGAGLGLSIKGYKAMVEMQFGDFVTCAFNQIVNNLAKLHYRWGQNADVVVRMPTGANTQAGPYHSQSTEAWFFHTPGLKIVYPSTPYDAKGLLNAAIEDPNPVMYFEHKYLYRSLAEDIPDDYYTVEIGKARTVQSGDDITIITYGLCVHWAVEIMQQIEGATAEILDLRTLLPWDKEAVAAAVRKTGKVLVAHEDCLTGGIGAEIAAWITEHCFESLDAPVMRVGALDTPVPFVKPLEQQFLPYSRMKEKIQELIAY